MEPGIKEGETVLVSRYHYLFKKPKVGEIIILKNPVQEKGKGYIIKRIQKIDKDKIFAVGDNRVESIDSRQFGWIEVNNIIGKVL